MGAEIVASPGGRLPLTIRGLRPAVPAEYRLDVASAQVKSALLLAALNTPGITRVFEPVATRDHTERMMKLFGVDIDSREGMISVRGEAELKPQPIDVPGDPSSAAFLAVAALIVPGSEIRLEGIGINPMRMGLYDMLARMGGDIAISNPRDASGEPVADLVVRHSPLRGIEVPRAIVPAMIDEFPIFFVAAAFAEGDTRAYGLSELRIKESDRITTMAEGLRAIGAKVEESGDGLVIGGSGGRALRGGATIRSRLDHRIAMSFAVAGLGCDQAVTIDDMTPAQTSYPGFAAALAALGAA
jgi:3-phosphoshikimate 1-carboxyvinyltransferase